MRDRRFDPILNFKKTNDFLSSTEDSTSGTESLSLSVSLTDGSLEVSLFIDLREMLVGLIAVFLINIIKIYFL